MSRSRSDRARKGLPRCICGRVEPCPVLDWYTALRRDRQHDFKERRIDVRHPIDEED